MKVLYVANARLPTEKAHGYQICKMCESFAAVGAEVHLLHPRRTQPSSLSGRTVFDYYGLRKNFQVRTLANWDVVRLERFLPLRIFSVLFMLHALLWGLCAVLTARRYGADLYFTRDIYCAFWFVLLKAPTIYEIHVDEGMLHRFFLRRLVRNPSLKKVVALAATLRDHCVSRLGCPPEKVLVLHHGVDTEQYNRVPEVAKCRKELEVPSDRKVLGYVGRFEVLGHDKGVMGILQAMALLCKTDTPTPLFLCVGGPMDAVPLYLQFAETSGIPRDSLRFVDRVPNADVPRWLNSCDAIVLPLNAGYMQNIGAMPLKLFEYMASGVPIVAPDLPVLREVLVHGRNAWLVVPDSDRSLADGIEEVLTTDGLARRLGRQAREDVQQYAWNERAARILRLA